MSMPVFQPLRAIRCKGNALVGHRAVHTNLLGRIGYYDGHMVIRWRCRHPECMYEADPEGGRRRVVTYHLDDIETGERVHNERMPYKERGERLAH